MKLFTIFLLSSAILVYQATNILAQESNARQIERQAERQELSTRRPAHDLSRLMSINIPLLYDMVANGSSLGMNVLSGMVKVERGDEAVKNGLVGNGRRPLSIRIFGVPIFERGTRIRPPSDSSAPRSPGVNDAEDSGEPLAE